MDFCKAYLECNAMICDKIHEPGRSYESKAIMLGQFEENLEAMRRYIEDYPKMYMPSQRTENYNPGENGGETQ